jgi:branched-chain amino acid transport system permease protein
MAILARVTVTVQSADARRLAIALGVAACAALAGLIPATLAPGFILLILLPATFDAIFATSIGFLLRQAGKISFGHAAFFGMAIYTSGLLFNRSGFPPELAILAALVVPTAFGFLVGLLIARIPGVAHAMLTLAVGQAIFEVAFKLRSVTNGDDGLTITPPRSLFGIEADFLLSPREMFLVSWIVLILVLLAIHLFRSTSLGELTEAIRDNPERTRFLGYGIVLPSAVVYACSAFIAAIAGVLFNLYNLFATPLSLHWTTSGMALVMAIIGGPRFLAGPALGAMVFYLIKEAAGSLSDLWPAIVGTVLIVVTLGAPRGLAGLLHDVWYRLRSASR